MNGYYSVKEIADKCGVSKTTVQRGIKELNLQHFQYKNMYLYDEKSTALLMRHIAPKISTPGNENQNETDRNETEQTAKNQNKNDSETKENEKSGAERQRTESNDNLIIDILQKQLAEKDKIIDSLLEQNNMLVKTNAFLTDTLEKTKQSALLTDKESVPIEEEPQRKSFWKRLFG